MTYIKGCHKKTWKYKIIYRKLWGKWSIDLSARVCSVPVIFKNVHLLQSSHYWHLIALSFFTHSHQGFPGGTVVKNPPAMQETQETWFWPLDQVGKIPWRIKRQPTPVFLPKEAWWATVHGITQLSTHAYTVIRDCRLFASRRTSGCCLDIWMDLHSLNYWPNEDTCERSL